MTRPEDRTKPPRNPDPKAGEKKAEVSQALDREIVRDLEPDGQSEKVRGGCMGSKPT